MIVPREIRMPSGLIETTASRQLQEIENKTNSENGHLVLIDIQWSSCILDISCLLNIKNTRDPFSGFVLLCTTLSSKVKPYLFVLADKHNRYIKKLKLEFFHQND